VIDSEGLLFVAVDSEGLLFVAESVLCAVCMQMDTNAAALPPIIFSYLYSDIVRL
jgi:hypothetical protein